MKNYDEITVLNFGKYKDKTLLEVAKTNFGYIEWCLLNVDHFYVGKSLLERLAARFKRSKVSENVLNAVAAKHRKLQKLEKEQEKEDNRYDEPNSWYNYNERDTYGQYSGSYAQDVEGLSDNFINDVLDGEPDAYWNID